MGNGLMGNGVMRERCDEKRCDVYRAGDRFRTAAPGLDSRHSFSFGPHYDPDNLNFGALLVHNEDRLDTGAGFDRHAHRGVDILTWVLAGALLHEDSTGRRHTLRAGMAQRLRAGSGVQHSEHATGPSGGPSGPAEDPGAHYVQMWTRSEVPGALPGYDWADFSAPLAQAASASPWVTVATGDAYPGAALTLDQPGAEFSVGRLSAGAPVTIAEAPRVHVFVARGAVSIAAAARPGYALAAGDAVRITGGGPCTVWPAGRAEVLVWRLPA